MLHDTEETLCDTMEIFLDPDKSVSSQYVISREGQVFQMVQVSAEQTDRA